MTRKKGSTITAEVLRAIVTYEPDTGVFRWNIRPGQSVHAGQIACNRRADGYLAMQYQNRLYKAHRLAWLYMTGAWPIETVDHINRDTADNRWDNLRLASRAQQTANRKTRSKTGFKGVAFCPQKGAKPYRAVFYHRAGQREHLGYFASAADAAAAYAQRALLRHGEFACLGM